MECVLAEDTDSLITDISEEEDQDLGEVTSVVPYNLQDVLPCTSGASVPMGTQYGEIDLNNSNMNHIGPKYVASNITIVNPPGTRVETSEPAVAKSDSCKVVFTATILVLLLLIGVSLIVWYVTADSHDDSNRIVNETKLVRRDEWGANPSVVNYTYRYPYPVKIIAITQTNTSSCSSLEVCSKIVREIQERDIEIMKDIDIRYNFLIGGDGRIYEGRGWSGPCDKPTSGQLVVRVGFIGDYSIHGRADFLTGQQKNAFSAFVGMSLKEYLAEMYQAQLECCADYRPSFVGYNLFKYYYDTYYPLSCPGYIYFPHQYTLCENITAV